MKDLTDLLELVTNELKDKITRYEMHIVDKKVTGTKKNYTFHCVVQTVLVVDGVRYVISSTPASVSVDGDFIVQLPDHAISLTMEGQ